MAATVQPVLETGTRRGVETCCRTGPWQRFLAPSISDLIFVAIIIALFLRPAGIGTLLGDGDTGWHIRAGEYILDTHSIPKTDLFSFTKAGQAWFAWEWLADVVYA